MSYTLWRNQEQIADVVELPSHEDPSILAGLVRPAPSFKDIRRILQVRMTSLPGQPVLQHDLPLESIAESVALRRLSGDEARGVPASDQLELRDSEGSVVPVDAIAIHEHTVAPGPGPFPDFCRSHGVLGSAWVLSASLRGGGDE